MYLGRKGFLKLVSKKKRLFFAKNWRKSPKIVITTLSPTYIHMENGLHTKNIYYQEKGITK
jgi:hypothetical protein